MKKRLALALVLFVSGCGVAKQDIKKDNENYLAVSENAYLIETKADFTVNYSDSDFLYSDSEYVVLATVDSLDGADNYSQVTEEYVMPYTYGTMTIHQVFKGDIAEGSEVVFYRNGGTLPFEQYFAGLNQTQQNKMNTVFSDQEKPEYVKNQFEGDIDLEVGKTYLFYLQDETTYRNQDDEYAIRGFQGGAREVEASASLSANSFNDIRVKNNYTGEWESLSVVLP